ncbi:MAG: c-type cytochrome [Balneolales bacterium]
MHHTSVFVLLFLFIGGNLVYIAPKGESSTQQPENSPPTVTILQPEHTMSISWNAQVRYAIHVSDAEDGDSRYNEISPLEVLLEIEFLPEMNSRDELNEQIEQIKQKAEPGGLALMRTSTCFACHADKTALAGPSFSEIAERYNREPETLQMLGSRIIEGSSGIWGDIPMPSNQEITREEAIQIASYILDQGENTTRWIFPGLEGAFRVIPKPPSVNRGTYVLTASYTDHGVDDKPQSQLQSRHTITIDIE